ncbi:MAG TPA: metallophosphoesterase [Candidatus Treponema faecavium]|nr:metallophosphoesterase [Candidatus Treponema faecavium]
MKRIVTALCIAAVCASVSCDLSLSISSGVAGNPFMRVIDLGQSAWTVSEETADGRIIAEKSSDVLPYDNSGVIRFPLIADMQFDRPAQNAAWYDSNFLEWLDDRDYPFLVNLGDLIDSGRLWQQKALSFYARAANKMHGNHIYAIGNHELYNNTSSDFDCYLSVFHADAGVGRMAHYVYGPLSIYKLDNSMRTFGGEQLRWLEQALAADSRPYRIIAAHEIVTSGGVFDKTLIIFGMDPKEVNRLLRIMDEHDVSLIVTGHHHAGNIIYRHQSDMAEFNAAAIHRSESDGYWYEVEIDTVQKKIRIIQYSAERAEPTGTVYTTGLNEHR